MIATSHHALRLVTLAALACLSASGWAADSGAMQPQTPGTAFELADVAPGQAAPYTPPAHVYVPASSQAKAGDAGRYARTHYVVHNPARVQVRELADLRQPAPAENPTPQATFAEYPASMACLYGMGKKYAGCTPTNNPAYNAKGGAGAIAIVIAYDNPTVQADLNYFSSYFGLPTPNFTKVIANGNGACVTPPFNYGWALESAMDTQWAHAMAPGARIILVEACSNSYANLMYAQQVARQQLLTYGGGQVSNSWGSGEWATESNDWDWVFRTHWEAGKPISTFFSSGDSGLGAGYPSSSPWVVSVGGTTVNRDPSTMAFQSESCWAGSGGGTSLYETYGTTFGTGTGPWTNFQYPLFGQTSRRTPDVSANADPASGAWVNYAGGWYVVGGTSLAAPIVAGVVNNSANKLGSAPSGGGYYSNMENNLLYAQLATAKEYGRNFYDVTTGSNGAAAGPGWDYCTGVGSPRGKFGK